MTRTIPVSDAAHIGKTRDFDQVVIIARKVGEDGNEHVTTWGRDRQHCDVARRIGDFLKFMVMGWEPGKAELHHAGSVTDDEIGEALADVIDIMQRSDADNMPGLTAPSVEEWHAALEKARGILSALGGSS